jgi:hypothetical protein
MNNAPNKYWPLLICLILALATLAVFTQVRNFDFVNYDDDRVRHGITLHGLGRHDKFLRLDYGIVGFEACQEYLGNSTTASGTPFMKLSGKYQLTQMSSLK